MSVGALILNWNGAAISKRAALSVAQQVDQVVLIDNASAPSDREVLRAFAEEHSMALLQNESNLGYAAGNNSGFAYARHLGLDAVLVMNNDVCAEPGAVALLRSRLADDGHIAAVAPAVVEMDRPNVVLHTGGEVDERSGGVSWVGRGMARDELPTDNRSTDYISGEAFLVKLVTLDRLGMFDERFRFYFEDAEWSLRARRHGLRLEVIPRSIFRHEVGGSMPSAYGEYMRARNRVLFLRAGLGLGRGRASWLSCRHALVSAGSLLRHGHPWLAMRPVVGWGVGVAKFS